MKPLVDICIEAISADEFWRLQRKQVLLLPEHLANMLLTKLLQKRRINHVQLGIFAPCATSICLLAHNQIGNGGAWLAAISQFRCLQTLRLEHCKQLRDDRLAWLALFSSTLQDLSLNTCSRLTFRAAQHLADLTSITRLDLSGTTVEVGGLLSLTGLASLRLADMKVGDHHCAGIATLTRLTELDLHSTGVSDSGVQGLSSLLRLQCLDVTWTKATAPPAVSSLTNLRMGMCQVGGEVAMRVLRSVRFPCLREVHMSRSTVDEAGIELLKAFCSDSASLLRVLTLAKASVDTVSFLAAARSLCKLDLSGVQIEDNSWEVLSWLMSLQDLTLQDSNATFETVKYLQELSSLQTLSLRQISFCDMGMPTLLDFKGSLTSLDISGSGLDGEPVSQREWGNLSHLHRLFVLDTWLTDSSIRALAAELGPSLTELHIGSVKLTTLSFLRSCQQLRVLEVDVCPLLTGPQFEAGVRHLHRLEELAVQDCIFVSKEAVIELKNILPNLRYIRWDSEVIMDAEGTIPVSRVGAALAARLRELAVFDERYCYSKEELLEVRSSRSVPLLIDSGDLTAMLDELELLAEQDESG